MQADALERLVCALREGGRRRISLDRLRNDFARACPELAEQADRRDHLAQLIQRAAAQGILSLPRSTKAWDRAGVAELPTFVVLSAPPVTRPAPIPGYAWHPLLNFAAYERNTRRLQTLRMINEWLKTDPDLTYSVPIKERSLEIFGDEKRLDHLRTGDAHFFDGQLKLAALGCRICPIPLPHERGPTEARGRPILIVENNDTWASFVVWNSLAARFSAIAYAGGGNAKGIAFDELFIDALLDSCCSTELFYFGDLDPRGIRIASGAAQRRAARKAAPLMPATILYRWLLRHGVRVPFEPTQATGADDLAWLPSELRSPVCELFGTRRRIPQECLGTRVLRHWDTVGDGAIPG
jgi:hypothetical protein